eukprot:3255897-Rhodomonas_salina.1
MSRPGLWAAGLTRKFQAELSTGPVGEGGLGRITGTHQSTADKGWGTKGISLVSRRKRSQGRLTCPRSPD